MINDSIIEELATIQTHDIIDKSDQEHQKEECEHIASETIITDIFDHM